MLWIVLSGVVGFAVARWLARDDARREALAWIAAAGCSVAVGLPLTAIGLGAGGVPPGMEEGRVVRPPGGEKLVRLQGADVYWCVERDGHAQLISTPIRRTLFYWSDDAEPRARWASAYVPAPGRWDWVFGRRRVDLSRGPRYELTLPRSEVVDLWR